MNTLFEVTGIEHIKDVAQGVLTVKQMIENMILNTQNAASRTLP